jgi:hypothetical protein
MFSTPRRPIHRWKSLWLGILVITFLGWAWWQSLHRWTMIGYHDYTIDHAGSGIALIDWKIGKKKPLHADHGNISPSNQTWAHPLLEAPDLFRSTGTPGEGDHYFTRDPGTFEPIPRNSAAQHFSALISSRVPGTWGLFLPHWLLILAFLIPWSALLAWRWKKAKHLTAPPNIER